MAQNDTGDANRTCFSQKWVASLVVYFHNILYPAKKDLQFIKQAESNIIILASLLNSNLKCKTVVQRQPHVRQWCT